jgi:hypothetical protein
LSFTSFFIVAAYCLCREGEQTDDSALKLPLSLGLPFCFSSISTISTRPKSHSKDNAIMADPYSPMFHKTQYERTEKIFEDGDIDKAIAEAQSNIA